MATKHVFPIVLDAAVETVAAAGALPVTTSFVKVNPGSANVSYTVADGTVPGQVMYIQSIASTATNNANITFTTAFDDLVNLLVLGDRGDTACYMWTPNGWFPLSAVSADSVG